VPDKVLEISIMNISTPIDKSISEPIKSCILCGDICVCAVPIHFDSIKDADSGTFVKEKLLCNKHDKKISRDYKKAKNKLICGLEYYKDLVYGIKLMLLKFHIAECTHVDDKELLKKRLFAIFQDYDEMVLSKENKEK
jgi:hypothetical protein